MTIFAVNGEHEFDAHSYKLTGGALIIVDDFESAVAIYGKGHWRSVVPSDILRVGPAYSVSSTDGVFQLPGKPQIAIDGETLLHGGAAFSPGHWISVVKIEEEAGDKAA